ncbi:MAG: hemolysin family protein [Cyanobacteriota bacterium]|nr:hemolysin family protein [Cyanobacteriota bacterium]
MALEILLILALILANGVLSGAEIAVVSSRRHRLEQRADKGDRPARTALRLAAAPNDFLSTVQIGITLIGILSGAMGGATVAERLAPTFERLPGLAGYGTSLSLVVVVGVITYLSLVVGELVPKRLALADPERLACLTAPAMARLSRLTAPLVHLLSRSTDAVLRLLGVATIATDAVTEEEIRALLRQGAETGVFEPSEHNMMQRVMRLGDRPIKSLMTPRTEICWLDLDEPPQVNMQRVIDSHHSRFPVARGSLDACRGLVRERQLLTAQLAGEPIDLEALMQPPLFVAESTRALSVLEDFRRTGIHVALVSDEFGGIAGLVTLNDLMEGIVGDLPSIDDRNGPPAVQRDDGSWLVDGGMDLEALVTLIDAPILDLEAERRFHTVAGFVLHVLQRIPRESDGFSWQGFRFEVVDMDGNRIDKLLITPPAQP